MNEIWRPVVGYEGYYEVSNFGRVKSLNYKRTGRPEILKPGNNGNGHLKVELSKDGKSKKFYVHRLVAQAFLEPVPGKDYIDHIDGNPENNVVTNLRYCTKPENDCFPLARENKSKAAKIAMNRPEVKEKVSKWSKLMWENPEFRENHSKAMINRPDQSKLVIQYTKSGEFIAEYPSTMEAQRQTGIACQHISHCCNGKRKSCGGYVWRYRV